MAPFSNSTEGDMFVGARCDYCVHRTGSGDPCAAFDPAFWGEWPDVLFRVERSPSNPLGIECSRFEPDEAA